MDKTQICIHYNDLFDVYGPLLTDHEQDIFKLFYEEDLSLQEIANEKKVSKSAIGKSIQIINKKLDHYEEKLHFLEKERSYLQKIAELNIKKVSSDEKK